MLLLMIVHQLRTGGDKNFSYVLADETTKEAAVIDPSYKFDEITKQVDFEKLTVKYVINTHNHTDHIFGNTPIVMRHKAQIVASIKEFIKADIKVKDHDTLQLGKYTLQFLYTPGHTIGHLCVLIENKLFTGDLLFVGKIGGTGILFPTSNDLDQWNSLQKIMQLPDGTEVYPGHDYGEKPSSTIGYEKQHNPFLQCKDFQAFQSLKRNWSSYKKEHNLE